jgi:hypothetical protein
MSVCFSARAEDMKLQNLVEWCNGEDAVIADPMAAKLMCTAWVGGFLSAMIFADGSATLKGLQKTNEICAPDDSVNKIGQLKEVLAKLSKDRPDLQHETARSVLFGVVRTLYACKK